MREHLASASTRTTGSVDVCQVSDTVLEPTETEIPTGHGLGDGDTGGNTEHYHGVRNCGCDIRRGLVLGE